MAKKQIKAPIEKKIRKKKKISVQEFTKSTSEIFNNRELGWLNFNLRVLYEATDTKNPLLERLKFLAISSSKAEPSFHLKPLRHCPLTRMLHRPLRSCFKVSILLRSGTRSDSIKGATR